MIVVYVLECSVTKEAYVGCTAGKIGKRMREHRCLLNQGIHKARRLQALWDEHKAHFQIRPLETLPDTATTTMKREAELKWLRAYEGQGLLLNDHAVSFSPPAGAQVKAAAARVKNGYRPSAESNEKRRQAQLGVPKGHGEKISATKQRNRLRDSLALQEKELQEVEDKEPRR